MTGFVQKTTIVQCHIPNAERKYQAGEKKPHHSLQLKRGQQLKRLPSFLLSALPLVAAQSQSPAGSALPSVAIPKTTQVLVIETPKEGVTFPKVFAVMPREARATMKLYLDGKIREWYSRGDGKGVVLLVDAKSVDEAREIIEPLPLNKEQLVDAQYIPVGPLVPLRVFLGPGAQQ